MIVWSTANQKGGVGKTTTTITLAGLLSKQNKKILLIDTDPHGSLTAYLGYNRDTIHMSLFELFQFKKIRKQNILSIILKTNMHGVDIVPGHISLATLDRVIVNKSGMGLILKRALFELYNDYDYVLIDSPPILGVMMVNALAASDRVLIPVQTEFLAMKGLEWMLRTLGMMQKSRDRSFKITIIPTMYDKRTNASLKTLNQLKKKYSNWMWDSAVPIDTKFRDASLRHLPISHFTTYSRSRGLMAYSQLLLYLERLNDDE
ncbi:replication initiation protein [Candidatus Photodesmus blepharus]|uniref:Replication initiation protein n=1 Tax=Candidatus Photodesmus blepharonis TaxID=1179155 RepID=A0A084CMW8_9GAMM|nr:ParA family protein [Candidatus Photodesmus blepharus]KEY91147.1 replication initiation protein [Candidatus Photodesmus blepharus]